MAEKTDSGIPADLIERLNPVDRFIVTCLRVQLEQPNGDSLMQAQNAAREFSGWNGLVRRSDFHGVVGWLHEVLLQMEEGIVPVEVMDELRTWRFRRMASMATASRDLNDISSELSERGVEHMLLKGPYLAECIYPRAGLRYYTDLDLLVRERDLEATDKALKGLGFMLLPVSSKEIFNEGKTQIHYHQAGHLPIDLHWDLINLPTHASSFSVDVGGIWSRADSARVFKNEVPVLSPEDLLLFQCVHMSAHHDFNRLLWFKDVEQAVCRFNGGIDWQKFMDLAEGYRLSTFAYYSLAMTRCICGDLPVPAWVMTRLRPRYLTARLFEHFINKSNLLELQASRRKPALEIWRVMRDDRNKRVSAILKRIFPRVEWYQACYPFLPKTRHRWIYYLAYPLLMLLRAVRQPIE